DVRERYYEVLAAQEALRAAHELEQLSERAVQAAEQLLKAKQNSRPDLLQAKLQLSAVKSSEDEARHRYEAAWRKLAVIIGIPDLPVGPVAGDLEQALPTLEWEASVERLFSESPLLRYQEEQIRSAQTALRLARAQAVPNVTFQLTVEHDQVLKLDTFETLV